MATQLHEIIRELLKEGSPYYEKQEELARYLGTDSPTISKIKFYKPEWEAHFQFFLKLTPIALKHDLIEARQLLTEEQYERYKHLESGESAKSHTRGKKKAHG